MAEITHTPNAAKTLDDLSMYVESLCPLDSEYIESEIKRVVQLIASSPNHPELRRAKFERAGRQFYVELIKTSSYVDHDVAILWAMSAEEQPVILHYQLQYLR
ncbi:hypothetical protein [Rhodococcoides fascians]|uniref:hypothetical protein n=1 Tax=Rhodococcoides fascians TaxID=1828 RepID=UPI0027886A2F|nr:hypothetical protein [Rhodococcus fascians]MDQ0281810.1 hypothetical protein [Rhodococcus fascians]